MPDREYQLKYTADNGDALAKTNVMIRALRLLDQVAERLAPKLRALYTGGNRGAGAAARANQNVAQSLGQVTTAAQATTQAVGQLGQAQVRTATSARAVASGFLRMHAASLALAEVRQVHEAIGAALEKARADAHQFAEELLHVKDQLRELAALKGKPGPDQAEVHAVADMMLASGATKEEAAEFATMWESTIPASRDMRDERGEATWKLTPQQEEELRVKTLQFAVAKGVKPETMATLISSMGIAEPITSVDQALGKMGAMHAMGNDAVGHISDVFKAAQKLRGSFIRADGGGPSRSNEDLMALISAASTVEGNSPKAGARALDQVYRESQKPAGRAIGITQDDAFPAILDRFAQVMDTGRAAGKSELQALQEAGFNAPSANMAIIRQARIRRLFHDRTAKVAGGGDPARVNAEIAGFRAGNPNRFAEASIDVSKLRRGEETEDLDVLRKFAEADLRNRHLVDTPGSDLAETLGDWTNLLHHEPMRQQRYDARIRQSIRSEVPDAARRFPDLAGTPDGLGRVPEQATGARLAAVLRQLQPEERQRVADALRAAARPDDDPDLVPAGRAAGMVPGGGGGAGPAGGAAAAAAGGDLKQLIEINRQQLAEQQRLNARVGGAPAPRPVAVGPLPVDQGGAVPGRK